MTYLFIPSFRVSTVLFFKETLKIIHDVDKYNIIRCPINYRTRIVEKGLRFQCGNVSTTVRCSPSICQITKYLQLGTEGSSL